MTVRPANGADASRIAALLAELGYPDNDPDSVHKRLENWTNHPRSTVLVAERDGFVAGVISVTAIPLLERDGWQGRIVALVTAESARGKGIGRQLVDAAEDFARKNGCGRMEVTSSNRRDAAHAFYRTLGYDNWADRSGRFVKDLI
ncbi:GNAT family N-acetyltransferase [Kibdelosporangium aridum]|uniref:GNAT family N-acetyltransferase n=1 Tax=Kibdelosporangium aridum TaxID=2030 RepID=A0A428ZC19_KIBAR|nr:GNAT family N-acetyltransferase [Kibdelosporangium aridum]RSM85571.1 GNAT family N-acetyltransferase [Kibdelosporangium aridum]